MRSIAKIALRNLGRQKKRTFLLGGAIAFSIFVVTVVNGFAGSFLRNVAGNFSALFSGHVFVQGVEVSGPRTRTVVVRDAEAAADAVRAAVGSAGTEVGALALRTNAEATLIFAGRSANQELLGIDAESEARLVNRLGLVEGRWPDSSDERGIVLGEKIARRLGMQIGDVATARLRTATGQFNVGDFALTGISKDFGVLGISMAYARRGYVNGLVDLRPGECTMIGVSLQDVARAERTKKAIEDELRARGAQVFALPEGARDRLSAMIGLSKKESWQGTKYRVITIDDYVSRLGPTVEAVYVLSTAVLLLLLAMTMVALVNTFRMIAFERVREIGAMRAIGARRNEVGSLLLFEAVFLASAAVFAGWAGAALTMAAASSIDFGTAGAASVFMKEGRLSFAVRLPVAALHFAATIALTAAAACIPARRAARMRPVEALRGAR